MNVLKQLRILGICNTAHCVEVAPSTMRLALMTIFLDFSAVPKVPNYHLCMMKDYCIQIVYSNFFPTTRGNIR